MDKKINLSISSIILFILNIIILISSIVIKSIYTNLGYNLNLVNTIFIIDIVILLLCVIFNIYIAISNKLNLKNVVIISLAIVFIYIIINIVIASSINKKNSSEYYKTTEKLINYCKDYYCNKYETTNLKGKMKFSLEKNYTDYNDETKLIAIDIFYNKGNVEKVESVIYSSNESYSVYLIKEQLSLYLKNFDIELDEESINSAFEKRDEESIKYNNQVYEVKSIYKDDLLDGFKTKIKISF